MGLEATTKATFKGSIAPRGTTATGKARLETDVIEFRSAELKMIVPFKAIRKLAAKNGTLQLTTAEGRLSLMLGPASARWAAKIQHPPSRLAKIGVKAEWKAAAIGIDDRKFLDELGAAVRSLSIGRVSAKRDAVFYGVSRESDLDRLPALTRAIVPTGAIWIVRRKGRRKFLRAR